MKPPIKYLLWGLAAVLVITIAGVTKLLFFSDWPGGMRSSYPAADHDPRLAREAITASPIIHAIQLFHDDHADYPTRGADLARYLPGVQSQDLTDNEIVINGWTYQRSTGGYTLSRALGWDPSLTYEFDGVHGDWQFDPGDGSPETTIVLP